MTCLPYLSAVATLPWKIAKSVFSNIAIVHWAYVRTFGWPHFRTNELGCITMQKLHCFTSAMCWHVVSKPGGLLHLGHDAGVHVSSADPRYGRFTSAACWDIGWISADHGGWCSWSVTREDWRHVSMQKVVTLNTCDVTFKLPYITTSSFQSHPHLVKSNIPSVRLISSAFHKVVQWQFSGVVGSSFYFEIT